MRNTIIVLSLLAVVILSGLLIIPADSYIPPTRAFMRIFSGNDNVTATSYAANLTLTPGTDIDIDMFYSNNTIRINSISGTPTLSMEDLTNVTDGGCASGQARTVNGTGWYVCTTLNAGDVSGAANVGTGTGTIFRDEIAGTLNLKTLKEGSGITLTNNADDITISSSGIAGYSKINNLDGGTAKILATNASSQATFKTLTAGTGITITNGSKTLTIDATGTGGFTSINNMAGGTAKILATNASSKANLKSLTAGSGISITNSSTTITIATSGSGFTELNSINGGNARILKSNSTSEGVFKSLTAGSNISLINGTDTITITATSSGGSDQQQTKRWGSFNPTSATTALNGFMTTSTTLEGTETLAYNTTRGVLGIDATTTAVGGLRYAGILQNATNFNIFRGDQNSYLWIEAAPAGSAPTGSRFFIGFKSTQQIIPRADTIVDSMSAFGICKRTTDTNYMRCENDGAGAGTYTSLGVAANANWHTFKVYATSNGASWCVELDGGTASCTSTDIPATTTRLYWEAVANQLPSTTVKTMRYGYVYVQNDK